MTYQDALKRGNKMGAGACDDEAAMALFCQHDIQLLVGSVSPQLVWEGARKSEMKLLDLARMCAKSPTDVEGLMWL